MILHTLWNSFGVFSLLAIITYPLWIHRVVKEDE